MMYINFYSPQKRSSRCAKQFAWKLSRW